MLSVITPKKLIDYFTQLDTEAKKNFLSLLKEYLKKKDEDTLPQSLEEYNMELEKADAEIEAGDFILHEDVIKYFSKK
jgi:hypothetical protein